MPIQTAGNSLVYYANQHAGVNRAGFQHNMDMKWLWDIKNGYISVNKDGLTFIQQRYGLSKHNSGAVLVNATTKIRYLFEAKWDDNTTTIFARAAAAWYTFNTGTDQYDSLDAGRTSDAKGFACMYENNTIMVDGGNVRVANSSLTLSTIGNGCPTDVTACWTHAGRLWVNSTANPMKFYGSAVGDHTTFNSTADSITVDLSNKIDAADTVVGFQSIGQTLLVVIMKNHIVIYNAPEIHAQIEIVQIIPIGAVSKYTSPNVGNFIPYASRTGVRTVRSSETTQKLDIADYTNLIAPYYRDRLEEDTDSEGVTAGFWHKRNHYLLTIHSSTVQTLVYSVDLNQVVGRYEFNGIDPYCWLELRDGTMLMGGNIGYVYKVFETADTDDDGNAINFLIETPYYGAESSTIHKAPREFEMLAETSAEVNFAINWGFGFDADSQGGGSIILNLDSGGSKWDTSPWDTSPWDAVGRKYFINADLTGRGRLINLRISHSQKSSIVKIVYWILRTILEGRK